MYSKFSNYNYTEGYADITIFDSGTPGTISNGVKDINEFWQNNLYPSSQNTFFTESVVPATSNVTLNHYPNFIDGGIIPAKSIFPG